MMPAFLRAARLSGAVILAVVAFVASAASAPGPAGSLAIETADFVRALTSEIASGLEAQATELRVQRDELQRQRAAATGEERAALDVKIVLLDRKIEYVTSDAARAKGNETAWTVYAWLNSFQKTLADMEDSLEQLDTWGPSIVDLDLMTAYRIGQARAAIEQASAAVDYVSKVRSLMETLKTLEKDSPTPQIRTMVTSLEAVLWGMEWIGSYCPAASPVLQEYSKAGQALTNAAVRLNNTLNRRHQGLLVEGRPDGGRLAAFDARFPEYAGQRDALNIEPLPGIRDAYRMPDGVVVIWEPAETRWHRTDLGAEEILRRYAFHAGYGNPDPKPEQILGRTASQRIIGLRVEAQDPVIPPGGSTTVRVLARRLDGVELEYLAIQLGARVETSALDLVRREVFGATGTAGKFAEPIVDPGKATRWTAPPAEHTVYRITASLPPSEREYEPIGPASCLVATGGTTTLRVTANPAIVEARGDGSIDYEVVDGQGRRVEPKGSITIIAPPELEVERPQWLSQTEARGTAPYHAPQKAGTYKVRVSFGGYVDAGFIYGKNYLPAEAQVEVQVTGGPPPTPVVADQPLRQGNNLVPGTYDGKDSYTPYNQYMVVLGGDAAGVSWSLTISQSGEVKNTWAGTLTPTGKTQFGASELAGEFDKPGAQRKGWARLWVGKDVNGNLVVGDMILFPERPTGSTFDYTRLFLTKRQ